MKVTNGNRIVGVDLVKVLAIFLVIVHHIAVCGIGVSSQNSSLITSFTCGVVMSTSYCCINLFAMASGYLSGGGALRYSRFANLWLQTVFIGLIGLIAINVFSGYSIRNSDLLLVCLPITRGAYWYFSAFAVLFLLSPILNVALRELSRDCIRNILLIAFILCCVSVPWQKDDPNGFGMGLLNGYSAIWLVLMYLTGGAVRKYAIGKISKRVCVCVVIGLIALCGVLSVMASAGIPHLSYFAYNIGISGGYRNPIITIESVLLFILCVQVTSWGKLADHLLHWGASVSFGVYLIHVHPLAWKTLTLPMMNTVVASSISTWCSIVFLGALAVFVVCGLLETCRQKVFEITRLDKVGMWVEEVLRERCNA